MSPSSGIRTLYTVYHITNSCINAHSYNRERLTDSHQLYSSFFQISTFPPSAPRSWGFIRFRKPKKLSGLRKLWELTRLKCPKVTGFASLLHKVMNMVANGRQGRLFLGSCLQEGREPRDAVFWVITQAGIGPFRVL